MWTIRNAIAVLAALVLASILSGAQVFREAALGSGGFNAGEAVRLLGFAVALTLIWTSAWRAAAQISASDPVSRLLHEGLPPFATLLILPGVYGLIHPFLSERAVTIVSWIFVMLLVATAVWFGLTLDGNAEALVLGAVAVKRRISDAAERRAQACQKCGASNSLAARFCTSCGTSLAQPFGHNDRVAPASDKDRSSTEMRRSA
jgi:ribosomal protein L40E